MSPWQTIWYVVLRQEFIQIGVLQFELVFWFTFSLGKALYIILKRFRPVKAVKSLAVRQVDYDLS